MSFKLKVKATAVQLEIAEGNPSANRLKVEQTVAKATGRGARLVVLPETWTAGFGPSASNPIQFTIPGHTHLLLGQRPRKKLRFLNQLEYLERVPSLKPTGGKNQPHGPAFLAPRLFPKVSLFPN